VAGLASAAEHHPLAAAMTTLGRLHVDISLQLIKMRHVV
jgi:hypothetical protein